MCDDYYENNEDEDFDDYDEDDAYERLALRAYECRCGGYLVKNGEVVRAADCVC